MVWKNADDRKSQYGKSSGEEEGVGGILEEESRSGGIGGGGQG